MSHKATEQILLHNHHHKSTTYPQIFASKKLDIFSVMPNAVDPLSIIIYFIGAVLYRSTLSIKLTILSLLLKINIIKAVQDIWAKKLIDNY